MEVFVGLYWADPRSVLHYITLQWPREAQIDPNSSIYPTSTPGEGGGTASLKVGTHCQTTAPAFQCCPPLSFFLPPPIFEGLRPPPPPPSPKSNIINTNLSTKVIQGLLHSFLYKECHVFHKIEGIQT